MNWRFAWSHRSFRVSLLWTLTSMTGIAVVMGRYLPWIEKRPGIVLDDPMVRAIGPVDFSTAIFASVYGSLIVGISLLGRDPVALNRAIRAYVLMNILRICTLWLVPLEPPSGMIPLHDPVTHVITGTVSKDLFFSGHIATLSLLALTAQSATMRTLFALTVMLVSAGLIIQHVHYSIDVVAAVPFALLAFALSNTRVLSDRPSA